ncbi:MAG: response regulator transcription factor [Saprospiraceae bacterium]|nr:response regulator transcription factor [Candidatus Defluviibacterium haderslevense]
METKIMIYEDNANLRLNLVTFLQFVNEFKIVSSKENPSEILADIKNFNPDLILMDIDMPLMDGISALRILRNSGNYIPVIMLTIFDDDENIYNSICAGASGYILKNDLENIRQAISEVLQGGAPLTGLVAKKIIQSFSGIKKEQVSKHDLLSDKENQILQELVKGQSYKMIAESLKISIDTVRTHIKKIYKKLEVNSATEAIFKAKHIQ